MVETQNLIIKNASFADLDKFAQWESMNEVIENFSLDHERDLDTLTNDFHRIVHDPSSRWLSIVLKSTRQTIGRVGLVSIDPINRSMNLKIIYIGEHSLRGKGLGKEAHRGVLEYAFNEMGLHRVYLDHFLNDTISEHLYDDIGFRKEGIMKQAGRHGDEFFDMQLRAMIREEWEEQKEILQAKDPDSVPKVRPDYL